MAHRNNSTLVCKGWHTVATRYLYRDILIRSPEQVELLLRTLREKSDLGGVVRTLVVAYGPGARLQAHECYDLLALCQNLQRVCIQEDSLSKTEQPLHRFSEIEQSLMILMDNSMRSELIYRAAESCRKALNVYVFERLSIFRDDHNICTNDCKTFDWEIAKECSACSVWYWVFLAYPSSLPSTVRTCTLSVRDLPLNPTTYQQALRLIKTLPPTISSLSIDFYNWPMPPLPQWTRQPLTSERYLRYTFAAGTISDLMNDAGEFENAIAVIKERVEMYRGGGLFELIFETCIDDEFMVGNMEEVACVDSILKYLGEARDEGRFDEVQLMVADQIMGIYCWHIPKERAALIARIQEFLEL